MSIKQVRQGSLGIAIESTPGEPESTPSIYLPYEEGMDMRGKHEPIPVVHAKASRLQDEGSVLGKRWGEGKIPAYLDIVAAGYLLKLALGNEVKTDISGGAEHNFYTTVSGNTPKTATLWYDRKTDCQRFARAAVDNLEIAISDELAKISVDVKSEFPSVAGGLTPTTTSGTILSFRDMMFQHSGVDIAAAEVAATTPISDFSITLANNLELLHRSQEGDVKAIQLGNFVASGNYTLFFEDETDKNAHLALNKRAMVVTLSGISFGSEREMLKIRLAQFRLDEHEISTGLDEFFAITGNFVAEVDRTQIPNQMDVVLRNTKTSLY